MQSANDIARWVVRYSADDLGAPVDPMSLEKLIYYAQAFHLVLNDDPLFPDEIHAWKWGPVIPEVYQSYSSYGSDPIVLPSGEESILRVGPAVGKFLADIVGFFCRHTATNLSRATHLEHPWMHANEAGGGTISQLSLKTFYRSLMEDGEMAMSRAELLDSAPEPRWSAFYVAGICWRKMNMHPFYDGVLARQLAKPPGERLILPENFYTPVKSRDFVEFTADEDVDETIRRTLS